MNFDKNIAKVKKQVAEQRRAGRVRAFAASAVAALLMGTMAFAGGVGPGMWGRGGSSVSSSQIQALAQAASGWVFNGTQSLAATDAAVATNSIMYFNGAARSVGISFDGTSFRMLGSSPWTPAADQFSSLGNPVDKRWSTVFAADYQRILGTSTGYSFPQGTITTNTTAVGNLGASGPDTLQTFTLPANALTVTGRGFKVRAWGTTANNANAKSVRLSFGSAALITKQLTASIAGTWDIEAVCIRTGASAQDCYVSANNNGGTTVSSTDGASVLRLAAFGAQTQTESGTLAIATQSTVSTSDNDIVSEGLVIEAL